MKRPLGLRTEIIISSGLLVGAALLFITLLLLRLSESRLLEQRITLLTDQSVALSHMLHHQPDEQMTRQLQHLSRNHDMVAWRLVDQHFTTLAASAVTPFNQRSERDVRLTLLKQSPLIQLSYVESWRQWRHMVPPAQQFVEISCSVSQQSATLALQVRYPLADITRQLHSQARLALLFCLGYGLILVMTAVFILNRAVISPIILLTHGTDRIAQGDLSQRVPQSGPREIEQLGQSFNVMAASLEHSINEQQLHFRQLQQAHDELQRTRQQLAHSERIAAVGNLTSGLAHELGNPLSAVIGYLELLKRQDDPGGRDLAERALAETGRMDQLIKDLLDFATPEADLADAQCNPLEVLQHSHEMLSLQGVFKTRQLHCDWPDRLPEVPLSPLKLQQILVNLLLNARDATGDSGQISLTAGQESQQIVICVKDNGQGIAPEHLPHLFDPFFTTKPAGQGRGLGLYVSYQLVIEAGGTLDVRSTPGQGSCFTLTLPIAKRENP